jgi:xanthine dehydrogenase accessory factor
MSGGTWTTAALRLLAAERGIVRVWVESTRGSAPREAGATMLYAHGGSWGSIGGGRLEWEALATAHQLLADETAAPRLAREFVLGPELHQCCGGRVTLGFERLTRADTWRLGNPPVAAGGLTLQLFGAGHVAQAMVRLLQDLPAFSLTWVDPRGRIPVWDAALPAYQQRENPLAAVAEAPRGSLVVVMTHDHALDYELCREVLLRDDALWLGLIASASKAARFRSRLARAGLGSQAARLLQAPIGLPGILGKEPAVIAISVVAQLLMLVSQATRPGTAHLADHASCGASHCAGCHPVERA